MPADFSTRPDCRLPQTLIALLIAVAVNLPCNAQENPQVYREQLRPHWFAEGQKFWYRNDNPGDVREFVVVDAEHKSRTLAFDHEAVREWLSQNADERNRQLERINFSADGKTVKLIATSATWSLNLETGEITATEHEEPDMRPLRATHKPEPSRLTGPATRIRFENHLEQPVDISWIDASGKTQPYFQLAAGETRTQPTYAGHTWLASEGQQQVVFRARRFPGKAVIGQGVFEREGETEEQEDFRRGRFNPPGDSVPSPDEEWEAFVRADNLWIREALSKNSHFPHHAVASIEMLVTTCWDYATRPIRDPDSGGEVYLSEMGSAESSFHHSAIRERAIGMQYERPDYPETLPEVHWSPDSQHVVAIRTDVVPEPQVTIVESSPADGLQPVVHHYPYIKPGDPIPLQHVHLFNVEEAREIPVDEELITNPWQLSHFQWSDDGQRFYFLYNQRGHQTMRVLALDAQTGELRPIVDEHCDTFFDYSQKTFLQILEEKNCLLWASERDGWNHLYRYNLDGGEPQQITRGEWVVRRVDYVDEENERIYFYASGIYPQRDPYYQHYCRVDLDGSNLKVLTEGDGTHTIQNSPDRKYFVDTWSRVDQPPIHELRSSDDGSLVCPLEEASAAELLAAGRTFPERFVAAGRDGVTPIYGIIHLPRDFDPAEKYPVIDSIYSGPHGQHVPKAFRSRGGPRQLTNAGFVVVQVDGMGTNWRSKKFHDFAWKNLADAGLPDHVAWLRAAAASHPWMDLDRVGIYGVSAGGQNAMRAVLDHGDFYKAAAADCGCHDNRMDKIWWNEAWLGWPVDESYVKSSNVEDAHKLSGKLLLAVGELDRNVDPSSTFQVVNALMKADKDFELLVVPGGGHGAGSGGYGSRRRLEFFQRYLQPAAN